MVKVFRGVAQVVERYFREVEAASSSLVTPSPVNHKKPDRYQGFGIYRASFVLGCFGVSFKDRMPFCAKRRGV